MEYRYEAIKHALDIPIKIFTQTLEQFPYHWHEDMELLLVLEGALEIRVDRIPYQLEEGDLFLVNQNELHFIKSNTVYGKTQLLALQFNAGHFKDYNLKLDQKKFHVYSSGDATRQVLYGEIRFILASMMDLVLNKPDYYPLKIDQLLIELITILLNQFQVVQTQDDKQGVQDERLLEILKYINDHCSDSSIGITEIAETFFLSPQYLSRYFKSQVGVSMKKFLDNMRLNKSLIALRTSDERVLDIALKFGFPDAKAYYRVFKEVLGLTPMQYRDKHKVEVDKRMSRDYFSINSQDSLKRLFKYLHHTRKEEILPMTSQTLVIDSQQTSPFKKNYMSLMTFGYAPHGLRSDFMEQLSQIQKHMPFQYIRFHGIFSDDFGIFNRDPMGRVYYDFSHVDALLDNLVKVGLKPFMELGFMPDQMASGSKTIFRYKANICPPEDYGLWAALIDAFIRHIINRYGLEEVRSWYFEFWNEPEIIDVFWGGDQNSFFKLYEVTYKTIKAIDNQLLVGGFGNIILEFMDDWLSAFDDYALANGVALDFYTYHVYNLRFADMTISLSDFTKILEMEKSQVDLSDAIRPFGARVGQEDYVTKRVDEGLKVAGHLTTKPDSIWITEWNAHTDCRDLVHDTCYMAPFIVKNVLDNHDKLSGMGFWTFTDIFEELQLEKSLFHGGFGLMTYNGIKKPSFYAYEFLSRLGEKMVDKGPGYVVTRRGDDYQILLYNYIHTNALYGALDNSQLTLTDRYEVFESDKQEKFSMVLEGLEGRYRIQKRRCNRSSGSAFDEWVSMGAPDHLTREGLDYLKYKSQPQVKLSNIVSQGSYQMDAVLEPHEIQLIELTKIY